jgi:hypothetical protein
VQILCKPYNFGRRDLQVVVESSDPPKKSARIRALIEGKSSWQAKMRPRSCSLENEDPKPLWWPEGRWPHLQHMPTPVSMVLEAPFADHLWPKCLNDLLKMP